MREFAYQRTDSVAGALSVVDGHEQARYLGGGTNLVDLMKLGVETPDLLVDVTGLPFDFVRDTSDGGLSVGATIRNSDLAAEPAVRQRFPVLAEALLAGASGQLRNLATVGGNLLQRTRCVYFQDVSKPCNKRRPGSGCPAREGEHRNLAILGGSPACIATHPSDMAVAMAALDVEVHVADAAGPREIPLRDFYRLPGDDPQHETNLAPGALVTSVTIPPLPPGTRSRYRKARDRASYAFAVGSVAAVLDVADGVVRDVRLGLGAVAPQPWRARIAEDALRGGPATPAAFAAAAEAELAEAQPLRDNGFKVPLLRNMITRTLSELTEEYR